MSGTPAAVFVRLRFGANPVARGRFHRGKAVPLLAEFFDPFTEAAVTPSGVAFSLFRPDGTELVIDEISGDGASRGCLLPTSQVGEHVVVVYTTAPSAEVGRIAFDVVEAEPGLSDDEQPAWVTEDATVVFPNGAPVMVKRIDRLPDLGDPEDGDKLVAVRGDAAGTLDWSAVSQAVVESAEASEAAQAARLGAETARDEAVAAALDAGLAAAGAKGVITVTLASGTVADGNVSTAFTGSATVVPSAGQLYAFKAPFLSRGAPVTLQLTVGGAQQTARSIRYASEGQLLDGAIPSGVWLLLLYLSNNIFAVIGLSSSQEAVAPTVWRINYKAPGDAKQRSHLDFFADGRVILYAGGDGTAEAPSMLEVQADGDLRALRGRWLTAAGTEVHNDGNPADIADDLAHVLAQVPIPIGRDNRGVGVVAVDQAQPYTVSTEPYLRIVRANTPLNFIGLQVNWKCQVEVQSGASAVAIAPPGMTWRGTASATQLSLGASKSFIVQRTQTEIYATQVPDFTTTSAAAAPSYARKVAANPAQSWAVQGEQDFWRYFQAEMIRLSAIEVAAERPAIDPSVFPIQGVARGGSPLMATNDDSDHTEGEGEEGNYHWWKNLSAAPGPLLTDALAVLADPTATGPGDLSTLFCLSFLGINDGLINTTGIGMNDTGSCTIASWSTAHLALQAATRTALSLPDLPWFMVFLPNQPVGVFAEGSLTAIRQAQAAVVAADANTHRGVETWDLWRWDDRRHLTYQAAGLVGLRLARAVAAALHGVNTYRGPKIVGVERASADHKRLDVTIRRNPTGVSGNIGLHRATAPVGFGIIPGSAGVVQGTRSTIRSFDWATSGSDDILQINTAADLDASPQLLFPDGFCAAARHRSRVIYGDDGVAFMPLQTHLVGDYVT